MENIFIFIAENYENLKTWHLSHFLKIFGADDKNFKQFQLTYIVW